MPAPSTSTISSSCESEETLSPWFPSSPMIGPAIATDSSAGITVMNGASTRPEDQEQQDEDEDERGALHLVAGIARLFLLVDVDGELAGEVHLHARGRSGGGDG